MDIRKLKYFIAVAEELHFNRAAERLNMTQPPLTQQIQALENELGVQLFERSRRHVQLTHAGVVFLEEARLILTQLERSIHATQLASQGITGHLNLAFVDSAAGGIMVDMLKVFRERYPQVQLSLREMTSTQQWQALQEGSIHVGFVRFIEPAKHIDCRTVANETLVAVLPEQHPSAKSPILSISALAAYPFILFPRQLGTPFHDLIIGFCAQHNVYPHVIQEAIQMYTIVNLVAANLGVSIVPSSVSVFRRSGVVFRPFVESTPVVPLCAAWRTDIKNAALSLFLETIADLDQTAIPSD
ncbi:LysR substrate-binding domain-containing protein [Paenibacillus sp. UMB4589-SE434]|uniref:LysR substrate-binding domain-containing protein n=1 Tax=Paenibacillus sp. UMB4589-SE434 TaxID=3046314 RepID=UPI00254A1092|nr:LysR substrate-binding domain-containing protein [Paenibacillus sp. UMB4589-SE434]MDK8179644.1 LysR substrate-binding domain-containing protein [Paenibacillus sp. UMB4589-SE434]